MAEAVLQHPARDGDCIARAMCPGQSGFTVRREKVADVMQKNMSLEDLLDYFRPTDVAYALRRLGASASGTKGELTDRLLLIDQHLESQGRRPLLDVLEAFRAQDLYFVCLRVGVDPGGKLEMVERLAEVAGVVNLRRLADRGLRAVGHILGPVRAMIGTEEDDIARCERLLAKAVSAVRQSVHRLVSEERELAAYTSWLEGGCRVATQLLHSSGWVRRAWGRGGNRQATALLEVLTLAMISRWYRALDSSSAYSKEERELARRISAGNLLGFFEDYSEGAVARTVTDFMKLDMQFNYDNDRNDNCLNEPRRFCEEENLIGLRVLWACGAPLALDLDGIAFPLTRHADHLEAGMREWTDSPGDSMALRSALASGTEKMLRKLDDVGPSAMAYAPAPLRKPAAPQA